MSDELRAAAEKIVADYEYAEKQGFTMWEERMLANALILARGYLATISDNGMAVTYQRLRNVGFTRGMQAASSNVLTLWSGKNYVSVDIEKGGFVRVAIGDLDVAEYLPAGFSMQTMGDIRRLCRALDIKLKEGGE